MVDPLKGVFSGEAPQSAPAKPEQVKNNAGGFVFKVIPVQRLRRFLILGTEGGTYYTNQREHTFKNVKFVQDFVSTEVGGLQAVLLAVEVSEGGLAHRNQPALFVLASAAVSPVESVRRAAYRALPKVARTGTHLFTSMEYSKNLRGGKLGSSGLKKALSRWYLDRSPNSLGMQLVKYRQREGWSHRDVLRLAKPIPNSDIRKELFAFATGKLEDESKTPFVVQGFRKVQEKGQELSASEAIQLISEYGLPWEALPDHVKSVPEVWDALLVKMGLNALIRQLPTLTRVGLLTSASAATKFVRGRLADAEALKKDRVHPIQVLMALKTYGSGASFMGSSTWNPVPKIVDALDEAFYLSFGAVEPTGKVLRLALDVSGSMASLISGTNLSAREASAAMALVTANVEDQYEIVGFTAGRGRSSRWDASALTELSITPKMRLDQVVKKVSGLPFGGTDCALPMTTATKSADTFDGFVVYTDNETWYGNVHPFQALKNYRQARSPEAKLAVVGMTATEFSIADPSDPGMLDVVGFDASAPNMMAAFMRGEV